MPGTISTAPTYLTGDAITLTRDEASAVAIELAWTCGDSSQFLRDEMGLDASSPEAYARTVGPAMRRLQLEAMIRSGGGWWGEESNPWALDLTARCKPGTHCPEEFPLTHLGAAALAEYLAARLPDFVADADEELSRAGDAIDDLDVEVAQRRRAALESLARRFGIEIEGT